MTSHAQECNAGIEEAQTKYPMPGFEGESCKEEYMGEGTEKQEEELVP